MSAYRNTYAYFLQPFSIENLLSTPEILPPVFEKQRGRPASKRIRKGAWKRKARKCSKCQGLGHNIRKCRFAPAVNGRQQRAWERELSIDSTSSSNLSDSLSPNLSSDVDTDDLDNLDRAESNLYYKRVATA